MRSPFPQAVSFAVAVLLSTSSLTAAEDSSPFALNSEDAIKKSASTLAWDMMQYYKGNLSGQIPGVLPGPPFQGEYYWWESGAMWGTLIDYWSLTGDATYNDEIMAGMQFQVGPDRDYQPPNFTLSLGNDDQGFWGMSAMLAAEAKFPDPPPDKPQWLALAQAVFNTQADPKRHDDLCGGGLHWQIPYTNTGYWYKNSIANGCFFNLGARLHRYTGNKTFIDWAIKTWDWMENVGLLDNSTYAIYDGTDSDTGCKVIRKVQWSYNNAIFAQGAAFLYNATKESVWKERTEKLVSYGLKTFFPDGIAVEIACENGDTCDTNQKTYKGFTHRWYSSITQLVPSTSEAVLPVLKNSTAAAVKQCTGGAFGRQCGLKWASGVYDGKTGAGQEMSVLAAVSSLLIGRSKPPVTDTTGGTSKGDPNAGSHGNDFQRHDQPVTTADRAGASILTIFVVASTGGALIWMCLGV